MCMYVFMNWYDVTWGKHVYTYTYTFLFVQAFQQPFFSLSVSFKVNVTKLMVFWGHFAEDGGDIDASEDLEGF